MSDKLAKSDSKIYRQNFYGILNDDGDFWTPIGFNSRAEAQRYLDDFITSTGVDRFQTMHRTHKIVPVRIRLDQLPDTTHE